MDENFDIIKDVLEEYPEEDKPKEVSKWVYSIVAGLLFALLAHPSVHKALGDRFNNPYGINGLGLLLLTVVYIVVVRVMMG